MRLQALLRLLIMLALVTLVIVSARAAGHGSRAAGVSATPLRSPSSEPDERGARSASIQLPLPAARMGESARPTRARAKASTITFAAPVYITNSANTEAAEPSIRVDRTDLNQRIWVTAPTGLGARIGVGPPLGGDLVWFSDNDGATWTQAGGPAGTTVVGGGDSDVAPGFGLEVYVTGLTLANVTLAASCNNGSNFATNPMTTIGTIEDRQWLDAYNERVRPLAAPDFLLDIGLADFDPATLPQENQRVAFYQILSTPACAPPLAGPPIDTGLPDCPAAPPPLKPDCYQWPGNLAIDEATGDAYVTYNTLGTDSLTGGQTVNDDKIVVARIDHGASAPATQLDTHVFTAAASRPDTFDSFTVVAVDRASNVYVLWNERHPAIPASNGTTATMYAYSKDKGLTWSAPIQINQVPPTTTFPWIVAGAGGMIDVVYYGTNATGFSPETVPSTAEWKVYMAQSLNAATPNPVFSEVVASPVVHNGLICTSGTDCAPGTRALLDYFQVDMDAQCKANIAYTDNFVHGTGNTTYVTFVQQTGGDVICSATAVVVSSFSARHVRSGVELRWRTGSEVSVLGYDVYRGGTKLNRALIRAKGTARGAAYSFVDRLVRGVASTYRLRAAQRDGSRTWVATKRFVAR
jgi:hypothetical protein